MSKLSYLLLLSVCFFQLSAQPFAVGHTTITFNDPSRTGGFGSGGGPGRQIQTEIYYPAVTAGNNTAVATGNFPVVVFGHGFVMSWDAYQPVYDSLARNGFVVALPRTEGSISPVHTEFGNDLAVVVTRMLQLNSTPTSLFENKLNGRAAIGGHSMGGGCTFLADQFNPNVQCYFSLAAAVTNPSSVTAATSITKPHLVIAGSYDCVAPPAQHQELMYNALASSCKNYVNITGAYHCRFSAANTNCLIGEGTCFPPSNGLSQDQQLAAVRNFLNPYLDYYLKGECEAWFDFQNKINAAAGVTVMQSCNNSVPQNVSISGATEFCSGTSTTLTALPAGFSYFWSNNANTQSINVNTAGSYAVVVGNGVCSESVSAVSVIENQVAVAPTQISGPDSLCYVDAPLLYTVSQAGTGNNNWDLVGSGSLSNESAMQVDVTASQNFILQYISSNTCGADTTSLAVVFNEAPSLNIQLLGDTFCQGDSMYVSVFNQPGVYYDWTFTDNSWSIQSGQGTSMVSLSAGSSTNVLQVFASTAHCFLTQQANFLLADTPQITISATGSFLTATAGFSSYSWYLNGNVVGTGNSITAPSSGQYQVVVASANGCEGSAWITVVLDGISETETDVLRVYPTVFTDWIQVETISGEKKEVQFMNPLGETIFLTVVDKLSRFQTTSLPAGIYFLRATNQIVPVIKP